MLIKFSAIDNVLSESLKLSPRIKFRIQAEIIGTPEIRFIVDLYL